MHIASYDAKDVTATIDGTFITGFAEGTFVEGEKSEDTIEVSVGAQGDVGISEINNPTGTITFTLQQTSPSVSYLTRLANSKKIVPVWVISNNEIKEKMGGTKARVLKPSGKTFSNNIEQRSFQVQVFDYTEE
ncbi:phage protein [Paenibacillus glucanolyticus]|uniref:phage structural protein n=1 Tax=Paenibacillus glucanolyticus TaxID=59843 RepID=UPI0035DD921D